MLKTARPTIEFHLSALHMRIEATDVSSPPQFPQLVCRDGVTNVAAS